MVGFKGLTEGARSVGVIAGIVIGVFAVVILGSLLKGVLVDTAHSDSIGIDNVTNASITTLGGQFDTLVQTFTNPLTLIVSLVVVAVLLALFFGGKLPGLNAGSGGGIQ